MAALFLALRERPRNEMDGEQIARALHTVGRVRRLEGGPYGGTPLQVGEDEVGQLLTFPLPESGPWQLAGIMDFSLAQAAFQLTRGLLWLPATDATRTHPLPMALLGTLIVEDPPYHLSIRSRWYDKRKPPQGPFDIHRPPVHPVPTYPALWAHDAPRERCMELEPDSEAIVRTSHSREIQEEINKKAARI